MASTLIPNGARRWLSLGLVLLAVGSAAPLHAAAPPPELKKVRILLVVDTNSDLKESVQIDGDRMKNLWSNHLPAGRYDLHILTGSQVTAENILNYYRRLQTGPTESLLFYYAGHGATDDRKGDYFYLQEGKTQPLLRSLLRKTMEEKRASLTILLTDCCSNRFPLPKRGLIQMAESPNLSNRTPGLSPVLRCLLYQHRGVVDITAATKSVAYGDDSRGGIFTRSLSQALVRPLPELIKRGDKFLTWKDFFPQLEREVETTFDWWAKSMRASGEKIGPGKQKPRAYSLGEAPALPSMTKPQLPVNNQPVQVVVSLQSDLEEAIRYQYRWTGETTWSRASLIAHGKTVLSRPLVYRDGKPPVLELRLDGNNSTTLVEPNRWTGQGTPPYGEGREIKLVRRAKARSLKEWQPEGEEVGGKNLSSNH